MEIVPAQGFAPSAGLDGGLIRMWLHGKATNTAAAYARDAQAFLSHCGRSIQAVRLEDLQAWDASMAGAAHASRKRRLAAAKSLLTFAQRVGYVQLNAGAALRLERATETACERILSTQDVRRMIATEPDARRRALLRLLYLCGLRASEAAGLRWRDMSGSEKKGGASRVLGKGGKLRQVEVPASLWRELAALAPAGGKGDAPVIPGVAGGPIDRKVVHRAVKRAARRAGVTEAASAHWLRHSHASHALDAGCKVHVLQQQLGHASLQTTTRYAHVRKGDGSSSFLEG